MKRIQGFGAFVFLVGCNSILGNSEGEFTAGTSGSSSSVSTGGGATSGGGTGGSTSTAGGTGSVGGGGSGGSGGAGATCGNGMLDPSEECDQAPPAASSCATVVAAGWVGDLVCTPNCTVDASGCKPPATTYSPNVADAGKWSTVNLGSFANFSAAKGFWGGAFDGQYVYLTPYRGGGAVVRYDTKGAFEQAKPEAWTTSSLTAMKLPAPASMLPGVEYVGAAFDGRFVYFVPWSLAKTNGFVLRFDTKSPSGFADPNGTAWSAFDVTSKNPSAVGFAGAVFDGRYLYFVPLVAAGPTPTSHMARLDTSKPDAFNDPNAWSVFDLTKVDANAKGYCGGTFDGRYLYFAPDKNTNGHHGLVLRFDSAAPDDFDSNAKSSWQKFDAATIGGGCVGCKGYHGAQFDGKHVYFAPYSNGAFHGNVVRFDASQPDKFSSADAWASVALPGGAKGMQSGGFDGRYLYLVPGNGESAVMVRFDTTADFKSPSSWVPFTTSTLVGNPVGFGGAVFDGRFMFLVPRENTAAATHGVVARFDTKTPSWLPEKWNASFF